MNNGLNHVFGHIWWGYMDKEVEASFSGFAKRPMAYLLSEAAYFTRSINHPVILFE